LGKIGGKSRSELHLAANPGARWGNGFDLEPETAVKSFFTAGWAPLVSPLRKDNRPGKGQPQLLSA
jgi:hypothetical protein